MKTAQRPKFRVGEYVRVKFGNTLLAARTIEDRGGLGVGGRRIYRIRAMEWPEPDNKFEVAEVDLLRPEPDDIPPPEEQTERF